VANEGYWFYSGCSCILEDTLLLGSSTNFETGEGVTSEGVDRLALKRLACGVLASGILGLLAFSSVHGSRIWDTSPRRDVR